MERKARRLLKGAPKRDQNETAEEHRRRVFAYLEEHAGTGAEAFEFYGVMLRLMGAPVPSREEERALARFARNLPPEPQPTPKASALIASIGADAVRVRYLEIWMQEGAERLVIYRIADEELRVARRYGSTRVDMWVSGELGSDEPDPQRPCRSEGRP